ncbi:MAG: hypothetical protein EOP35_11405 [Rubrivivax sp.]|nr:MAG: hypothetical protein EOP35_11405 [Rubrivivax sp.]
MNTAVLLQILLVPWDQRDRANPWVRRIIYGLVLLLVVGSVVMLDGPARWGLATAVGAMALVGAWMVVASSLMEQNHPQAARFVPRHLRRLRQAALLGWAVASVLPVLAAWLLLEIPVPPAVVLLASSCVMCFLFRSAGNVWLWISLALGWPLLTLLQPQLLVLWSSLAALWRANDLGMLALALLAQVWLVWQAFGNGDAAHQARYGRLVRMRQLSRLAMEGKQSGLAAWGGPGEWLGQPFERITSAWLRHVIGQANPGKASVMARAEIVLHGPQHWLRQLVAIGFTLGLLLLIFSVAAGALAGAKTFWVQGSTGIGIGILSAGFNPSFALPGTLWHSRREQALLRLLPGMPLGGVLNRAVAWRQLRQGLTAWALSTLAVLPLAVHANNALLVWLPLASLPFMVGVLTRIPATMKAPSIWTTVMPTLAFMLLGSALFGIGSLLKLPMWALLPAAAVSLTLSAALLAWRWRRLSAAPTALPAGRLA